MPKPKYALKPVTEKPRATYTKKSWFDPLLDEFLAGSDDVVKLEIDKRVDTVRVSLLRRIKTRCLPVKVSLRNSELYLEKVLSPE
jgi:hypothetical protein